MRPRIIPTFKEYGSTRSRWIATGLRTPKSREAERFDSRWAPNRQPAAKAKLPILTSSALGFGRTGVLMMIDLRPHDGASACRLTLLYKFHSLCDRDCSRESVHEKHLVEGPGTSRGGHSESV